MSIYADSSFMVALRVPHDNWHRAATGYYEKLQDDAWLWSPWHRVEVFNTIRQLVRHPDSRRSVSVAEARSLINRIENEIRLGYFLHMEADWRDVIRTASEISVARAFQQACPGTDLFACRLRRGTSC